MNTLISRLSLLSAVLVLAAPARPAPPAEDASMQPAVGGPVLGYVLDSEGQAIRPVNGIPGAAHLGAPLDLSFPIESAAFSSRSEFALVGSAAGDHAVYLIRNLRATPRSAEPIEAAISSAGRIVLNANDSAAVLYSARDGKVQIIRGLPDNPAAGPALDLSAVPGKVNALALDRAGFRLLLAASDGNQGALYLWNTSADPQAPLRLISNFASPAALALLHNDQDAMVADAALNQLVLIRDFAGSADVFLLGGERDGVSNPAGLEASADGKKLFLANAGTRSLDIWDLAAQAVETRLALDAAPDRMIRLQAPSVFVLNAIGDDPLLLFDTSESQAVYFVPAGREQ